MGQVKSKCSKCGNCFQERCNAWVYGSPIRKCPKCGSEFLDKQWREVAIDGFDPRAKDASFYGKGILLFLAATILLGAWLVYNIKTRGSYPTKLLGCVCLCGFATILCVVMRIRYATGYEEKKNQIYLEESKKRLQDKVYVEKLISFGYPVPEEYRSTKVNGKEV